MMPRILKVTLLAVALVAGGFLIYQAARPSPQQPMPRAIVKGVSATPATAGELVGQYYTGDGLGTRIWLTLKPAGVYDAVWKSCGGTNCTLTGRWSLISSQLLFTDETDGAGYMLMQKLTNLEIQKFRGHWIFVPTDEDFRGYYNEFGVDRVSCFQNVSNLYGW